MEVAIIFFIVVAGVSVAAYLGNRQKHNRLEDGNNQDYTPFITCDDIDTPIDLFWETGYGS